MVNFIVLTISSIVVGGVLFSSAFFGSRGTLSRNSWIGIRLESTLSSDVAWKAGHKAALRWGIVAIVDDICCLIVGFVFLLVDGESHRAVWGPGTALVTNILITVPYVYSAYRVTRGSTVNQTR